MNVFKNKLNWGVEVLGDILTNSLYRKTAVENERSTIYTELLETQKMQMETTVETSHYGVLSITHANTLSLSPFLLFYQLSSHIIPPTDCIIWTSLIF